jgi:hypothetical protein
MKFRITFHLQLVGEYTDFRSVISVTRLLSLSISFGVLDGECACDRRGSVSACETITK